MTNSGLTFHLHTPSIVRGLTVSAVLIVLLGFVVLGVRFLGGYEYAFGFVPLFLLDNENNIPTYYATLLHLSSGGLLGLIALRAFRESRNYPRHWAFLSTLFLFLSIDESSSLHELMIAPVRMGLETSGIFYFAWVIPAAGLLVILGLTYLKFLTALPTRTMIRFLVSGLFFVSGAIGLELVGGLIASDAGTETLSFHLMASVEETLEITGMVLFIRALMLYLLESGTKLRFSVD